MMTRTPNSNRKHITFFGKRNAGKSTLFNLLIDQEMSLVSEVLGTTTDPVYKAMELIGYGAVRIIDTAGLDDDGVLGKLRVEKTEEILQKTDLAVYVLNKDENYKDERKKAEDLFKRFDIPYIFVWNKLDLVKDDEKEGLKKENRNDCFLEEKDEVKREQLVEAILKGLEKSEEEPALLKDIVLKNSHVVLVVPIDSEAPKGRLILPQVQVIRDCLDNGIKVTVVRETELEEALKEISRVDLVITDSQVFGIVDRIVPKTIPLTSFSILFARQKGQIHEFLEGIKVLESLKDKKNSTV